MTSIDLKDAFHHVSAVKRAQGLAKTDDFSTEQLNHNKQTARQQDPPKKKVKQAIDFDYVIEPVDATSLATFDPDLANQFMHVFESCHVPLSAPHQDKDTQNQQQPAPDKATDASNAPSTETRPLSKRKRKRAGRYTLDELKQLSLNPEVIEPWDPTLPEPLLLADLKACRNTVPVPGHWRSRRNYLYSFQDHDKPELHQSTGVVEMRDQEKALDKARRQKAKTRARRRGKLSKSVLDYEDLYNAFFKHQTSPKLTVHGELYYERKAFVDSMKQFRPGQLSKPLKAALGISSDLTPPPWLHQMQHHGPPPHYPWLAIPGLNAAIPEGAAPGFGRDGWGKIPEDELGRPLYGFKQPEARTQPAIENVDRKRWGDLDDDTLADDDGEEQGANSPLPGDIRLEQLDTPAHLLPRTITSEVATANRDVQQNVAADTDDDDQHRPIAPFTLSGRAFLTKKKRPSQKAQ
ncbi:DUF382-domain-containing protein [Hesseltinella vesiculosa]|uniref:DUF382-domain-containing protein n=1 Tax=Hesseltinella vesiculosa TaxID=101127 RepID=A0A1X2GVZ0_9FUNG|nr:DUF382-domain-containing protein [Hesseltinella vesiculosa]